MCLLASKSGRMTYKYITRCICLSHNDLLKAENAILTCKVSIYCCRPLPSQSPILGDGPGSSSSKDKSSLQSSFDADHSGIRQLYSQFGGGAASLRNMDGQGMEEQLLLATEQLDDDDQFAGNRQARSIQSCANKKSASSGLIKTPLSSQYCMAI